MLQSILNRFARRAGVPVLLAGVGMAGFGCQQGQIGSGVKSFLDPSQVGNDAPSGKIVQIVDNLSGEDEDLVSFVNARDVTPADLINDAQDYGISPNDMLQITLSDLAGPGTESIRNVRVSQTGQIVLPLLNKPVQAKGLSEAQLQQAIIDAYRDAQVIQNAQVSVSVVEARGRTYTVSGAVNAESPYYINDNDFRVLDAIVAARGVTSPIGIDTVYVIRRKDSAATEPAPRTAPEGGVDPLAPQGSLRQNAVPLAVRDPMPRRVVHFKQDAAAETQVPAGNSVIVEGQDVQITAPPAATSPATQPLAGETPVATGDFEFNSLSEPGDREVIRIPYDKLRAGQLKYNIVIKPGDTVLVPQPLTGVYYIGGNVQAPGTYSMSPTKITISQAVIAARGLNEVAWPSRTEITRRLPGDRKVFVKVDLNKVFAGEEADIYLKPDDSIVVGTDLIAPFLASFRNGFRVTYGFGFLYDRNYAPDNRDN